MVLRCSIQCVPDKLTPLASITASSTEVAPLRYNLCVDFPYADADNFSPSKDKNFLFGQLTVVASFFFFFARKLTIQQIFFLRMKKLFVSAQGQATRTGKNLKALHLVTLNPKSVTEIINKLPDNLNGPVLPYRMISF